MPRLLGRCLPRMCVPRKKRKSLTICEQQPSGTRHQHQVEINKLFVRRVESIRVTQKVAAAKRPPLPPPTERHHHHHHNQQLNKKTKSKAPVHGSHGLFRSKENVDKMTKPDDTELDCETHISDRRSRHTHRAKSKLSQKTHANKKQSVRQKKPSEASEEKPPNRTRQNHLAQLFNKTKDKTTRPTPESSSVIDIHGREDEDHLDDTTGSTSSSLSSDWSTTTYPDSQSSKKSNDPIEPVQRRQSMPVPMTTNENLDEIKHRSCVGSFYLGREHVPQPMPLIPTLSMAKIKEEKEKSIAEQFQRHCKMNKDARTPAKSKQVLQNVRKMIKDQSVQQQHFNGARQRESVRL